MEQRGGARQKGESLITADSVDTLLVQYSESIYLDAVVMLVVVVNYKTEALVGGIE